MKRTISIILFFILIFTLLAIVSAYREIMTGRYVIHDTVYVVDKYYGMDTTELDLTEDNLDSLFNYSYMKSLTKEK